MNTAITIIANNTITTITITITATTLLNHHTKQYLDKQRGMIGMQRLKR